MSPTRGSAAPRSAPAEPTRAEPACPKCGAPRAVEACPRCGLVYARWQGFRRAVSTDRLETERLWRETAGDFLTPQRHAVFIAHCLHAGELPYAVARYAEELRGADVARARVARERRRQVATMAEVMWLAPARSAQRRDGPWRRVLRLVGGVAVIVALGTAAITAGAALGARRPRAVNLVLDLTAAPASISVASPASAEVAARGDSSTSRPPARPDLRVPRSAE